VVQEFVHARRIPAECQAQETSGQRKVLEEIPKRIAAAARTSQSKIAAPPKLLPQQRGCGAVDRKNERCYAICDPGDNACGHHYLDKEANEDREARKCSIPDGDGRLSLRIIEVQHLVERTERQKQEHQKGARNSHEDDVEQGASGAGGSRYDSKIRRSIGLLAMM
jgi:hypothetical protein